MFLLEDCSLNLFPLQYLYDQYNIQFDQVESNIIQIIHKCFWLIYENKRNKLPQGFLGTPLELWGLIIIFCAKFAPIIDQTIISFPDLIPQEYRNEFHILSNQHEPPTIILRQILSKICRPMIQPIFNHRNLSRFYMNSTLDNIQLVIDDIHPSIRTQNLFPINRELNHEISLTDDEIQMIQINYTQLLWIQYVLGDTLMIPLPTEGTSMEIWVIQQIVSKKLRLKTRNEIESYDTIGQMVMHMYNSLNQSNYVKKHIQKCIRHKISKINYDICYRRRNLWAFTMALSSQPRNKSNVKKLTPELNNTIQKFIYP